MNFLLVSCVAFAIALQINFVSALNCYECDSKSADCPATGVDSNKLNTKECKPDNVCVIYTKTDDKSVTYRDCATSCDKIEGKESCASCSANGCNINSMDSITTTTTSTTQKPNGASTGATNVFALVASVLVTRVVASM
ncbi:uncharacterized protein LOC126734857 [Anthonomus grandis grandis]|uniref:uncharacterized protein LOC126734857 n=1 Tax=Anthonomus grandis grandis TaxID=2921223 RepID=UPI0021666EA5|nr:uncharacterized protein LOC126734857 [Anthonomus grandis grandis]